MNIQIIDSWITREILSAMKQGQMSDKIIYKSATEIAKEDAEKRGILNQIDGIRKGFVRTSCLYVLEKVNFNSGSFQLNEMIQAENIADFSKRLKRLTKAGDGTFNLLYRPVEVINCTDYSRWNLPLNDHEISTLQQA